MKITRFAFLLVPIALIWLIGTKVNADGPTGLQSFRTPAAPTLTVTTSWTKITASWTTVAGATGYTLYYAPYPYTGPASIKSINMGDNTGISAALLPGAAFYVAVMAYDSAGSSGYSNIELFILPGKVPDTGQTQCYDDSAEITCPQSGEDFYGQDTKLYNQPSFLYQAGSRRKRFA